jgi:16S rRNA processing protein RimM
MSEKYVDARLIGIIGKPHGVKGEVTMTLLTDYPNTISKGAVLFLDEKCTCKIEVENLRCLKTKSNACFTIIKFRGIDNRNQAESLKGMKVFRNTGDSPELKEDQYWTDDIVGCRVYTAKDIFIGRVKDIEKYAANDNLVVKIETKNSFTGLIKDSILYIPVIEDYIKDIDLKNRKIILKRIPEYA